MDDRHVCDYIHIPCINILYIERSLLHVHVYYNIQYKSTHIYILLLWNAKLTIFQEKSHESTMLINVDEF